MPDITTTKRPKRTLPFEIRQSHIQGQGAFATRRIAKGQRVIEYTGERITQEQADERYDDAAMSRHHTFLFTLDEDTVVDGAVNGNESRFINHGCDPNCQAFTEGNRIYIYALRDIEPGEELSYDYGYERHEDMTAEDEARYVCKCGAKKCRGTILAPPKPPKKTAARSRKKAAKSPRKKKSAAKRGGGKGPRRPGPKKGSTRGKGAKRASRR
ncbi:SET domain-containing protein-lysine N-methyltransferase [Myxococcaceae bacterium GXIMD 01537]